MANRYNFSSTAGAIGDALAEEMAQRELQRRQALKEAQDAEELRMKQAADKRAADIAASQEETAKVTRAAAQDAITRNQRTDVEKRLGEVGMGGEVTGDLLAQAQKLTPESLKVTQSHTQDTLPASTVDPNTGERTQFSQATPFTVADKTTFAGTGQQRLATELGTKMGGAKTRQEAVQIALGAGVPANQVDDVVNTLFKPKGNLWWMTRSGQLQFIGPDGKPTAPPAGVTYDKTTDTVEKEPAPPGGQNAAPFMMAIPTATGTEIINGRDERNAGRSFSLRPTGAQQQDLSNNAMALTQIQLIKEDFNPDWVGPAAGRIGSMYTAFVDDAAGLNKMQTRVASLKNRFVKAITGAQMSEPEAKRIMSQLPDMNLPPTAFMERLNVAEQELNNLMEIQQQVYTGQRQSTGNPVTEVQLNKLFPDSMYTGGPAKKGEKTTETPAPKTETTPKKSKYQVTVG